MSEIQTLVQVSNSIDHGIVESDFLAVRDGVWEMREMFFQKDTDTQQYNIDLVYYYGTQLDIRLEKALRGNSGSIADFLLHERRVATLLTYSGNIHDEMYNPQAGLVIVTDPIHRENIPAKERFLKCKAVLDVLKVELLDENHPAMTHINAYLKALESDLTDPDLA